MTQDRLRQHERPTALDNRVRENRTTYGRMTQDRENRSMTQDRLRQHERPTALDNRVRYNRSAIKKAELRSRENQARENRQRAQNLRREQRKALKFSREGRRP